MKRNINKIYQTTQPSTFAIRTSKPATKNCKRAYHSGATCATRSGDVVPLIKLNNFST